MGVLLSGIHKYRQALKYWWLTLLLGLVMLTTGILVFAYPGQSYMALAIFFGFMIIFSGILQTFIGAYAPKGSGGGWIIALGVMEIILGFIISFNLFVAMSILPFLLGFWLLFRGIMMAVMASDLRKGNVQGRGWIVFYSVLVIIAALIILVFPFVGVGALVIWMGLSFLVSAIPMISLALHMRSLRKHLDAK